MLFRDGLMCTTPGTFEGNAPLRQEVLDCLDAWVPKKGKPVIEQFIHGLHTRRLARGRRLIGVRLCRHFPYRYRVPLIAVVPEQNRGLFEKVNFPSIFWHIFITKMLFNPDHILKSDLSPKRNIAVYSLVTLLVICQPVERYVCFAKRPAKDNGIPQSLL